MFIHEEIEAFVKDKLKLLVSRKHSSDCINHEDKAHYRGVMAGKRQAYEDILLEIKELIESR